MTKRFLPSLLPMVSSNKRFHIITRSLILVIAVWLTGCVNDITVDEVSDDEADPGKIVMNQTGGIAGFSRTIAIQEEHGLIFLVYTDHVSNQRKESQVSPEDLEQLWQSLEANDVFTLPMNHTLLETVRDGFFYDVTVQKGEKYNRFSVYTPDLLTESGEGRYNAVIQSIEHFTDSQLKASGIEGSEYIIADMPINDFSVQILESFPLQVHLVVAGFLRDSCTILNETTQRREGSTVHVHITTKRPKDAMCAQVITEVTVRIPLEGGFLPGHYRVITNDVVKEFDIQNGAEPGNGAVKGKVTIGPLCPVEPCNLPPERIAEIYQARKVIIYEKETEIKIAEAHLSPDGEYSFSLRQGNYIVDVSDAEGNELPLDLAGRPRIGNAIPMEVEVRPGEEAVVDFDIDTGIR